MEYWEDYEVIEIETPELLTLQLPLAGFGPRALAFLVDNILITVAQVIIAGVLIIIGITASIFEGLAGQDGGLALALLILFILIVLLVYPAYYIIFEGMWNGQTPGKRMTGIRVVRRGGLPLNAQAVWMRNLMRLVDMLPSSNFAGLISFFASARQQRIGDLVADTVVVREFANDQPVSWVQSYGRAAPAAAPQGTVTPRIALAIGNYLNRATEFDPVLRQRLSADLVAALGYSAEAMGLRQRDEYLASVLSHYHSQA